jgi:DNA mismatch endonuclease (patch repair protein)
MQNQRQRDTRVEIAVRRFLHGQGLRFRVNSPPLSDLRRRADLVFRAARVAVFVDGCFWHGCPQHATWPAANRAWWRRKLLTNRRRDGDTDRLLAAAGWLSVRVWEHEDPSRAARRIAAAVRRRRRAARDEP